MADGHPTTATNLAKLKHRVRDPAHTVNMVPELAQQSLLIGGGLLKQGVCTYLMETSSIYMMDALQQ